MGNTRCPLAFRAIRVRAVRAAVRGCGSSVTAETIELRCRAHNAYAAPVYFELIAEITASE